MQPMEMEAPKKEAEKGFFSQCWDDLQNNKVTRRRWTALGWALLLILFFILGMIYGADRSKRLQTQNGIVTPTPFAQPCFNLLDVMCSPSTDPNEQLSFRIRFPTVDPGVGGSGGFASLTVRYVFPQALYQTHRNNAFPRRARNEMHVLLNENVFSFAFNDVVPSESSVRLPLTTGSLSYYPFDEYTLDLMIGISIKPNPFNATLHPGLPSHFEVNVDGQEYPLALHGQGYLNTNVKVPGYGISISDYLAAINDTVDTLYLDAFMLPSNIRVVDTTAGPFELNTRFIPANTKLIENGVDDYGTLRITFTRPAVSKLYPICVVVGMWGILIAELYVLYWMTVLRYKKTDNPAMLGFFAAVIFALPSLRNSMPFNPPMGILIDFAAFFWAEIIAMAALLIISIRFAIDTSPHIQPNQAPPPPQRRQSGL